MKTKPLYFLKVGNEVTQAFKSLQSLKSHITKAVFRDCSNSLSITLQDCEINNPPAAKGACNT